MISWGTKYDPIGEFDDVISEQCKICGEKSKPVYKLEQAYFKLYGLPILRTKKLVYKTCSLCNTRLKAKTNDGNLDSVYRALPVKLKFKYIWGWFVFLPLIIGATYLIITINK